MNTAVRLISQVKDALGHLNPSEVREDARKPFTIQLFASSNDGFLQMEDWLVPPDQADSRREEAFLMVRRGSDYANGTVIRICEQGLSRGPDDFVFIRQHPNQLVTEVLERHADLRLTLARWLAPFREPVVQGIIRDISKENALFAIATSIPSIVPVLSIPWAVGEFASDTAFLTGNQIRMAFMLAAASDRTIGYRQQKGEIASMFAGAFGWRAIARELVGKIPFGGGVIPKAAVAYAGTYVVGASLERLYRVGYGYSASERKEVYASALEKGKQVASTIARGFSQKKG